MLVRDEQPLDADGHWKPDTFFAAALRGDDHRLGLIALPLTRQNTLFSCPTGARQTRNRVITIAPQHEFPNALWRAFDRELGNRIVVAELKFLRAIEQIALHARAQPETREKRLGQKLRVDGNTDAHNVD